MKTQGICCGRRGCMKIIGLTFLIGFAAAQTVLASPEFATRRKNGRPCGTMCWNMRNWQI